MYGCFIFPLNKQLNSLCVEEKHLNPYITINNIFVFYI